MRRAIIHTLLVLLAGSACRQPAAVDPGGCQFVTKSDGLTITYQFDTNSRITHVTKNQSGSNTDYSYTFKGNQVSIQVTDFQSSYQNVSYEVALNQQGYAQTAQQTTIQTGTVTNTSTTSLTHSYTFAYDAQGYLTDYRDDHFYYPFSAPKTTSTVELHLTYLDGNPVTITTKNTDNGRAAGMSTSANTYGTVVNPLKMPLLIELIPGNSFDSPALQPLLGKPSRNLLSVAIRSDNYSQSTTNFAYQFDAKGRPIQVSHPNQPLAPGYTFEHTCP